MRRQGACRTGRARTALLVLASVAALAGPPALAEDPPEAGPQVERARALVLDARALAAERRYDEAVDRLERSVAVLRKELGEVAETARAIAELGRTLHDAARPGPALPVLEEALALLRKLLPAGHPELALTLNSLGMTHAALGRHADAVAPLEESLAIVRRLAAGDSADVATGLGNLAVAYGGLGRHADALRLEEEALAIRRRLHPDDDPLLVLSLNNIALTHHALGRPADAVAPLEEALAMARRLARGDDPFVASCLDNLAGIYGDLGRPSDSLPLREEALAMRQRLFPAAHPAVARSLDNVASTYVGVGRHAEALPLMERALAVWRRLFPDDHPDVAASLTNLAVTLDAVGRHADALPLGEEALEMRRRLHPGDHAEVAGCLNNLAVTYDALGRHAEAAALAEEALAMTRELFDGDHPDVAQSLSNVAAAYDVLGRHADALPIKEEALAMYRRIFPGDHPGVALALANLAFTYGALGRQADALPLEEEALRMRRSLWPDGHPLVVQSLVNLGQSYAALGRKEEATAHLRAAVEENARSGWGERHVPLALLGRQLVGDGRFEEAVPFLRDAVESLEDLRRKAKALGPADRSRYVAGARRWDPYPPMVEAQVALGNPSEALAFLERGRGREMLDLLERGRIDPLARAEERARRQHDAAAAEEIETVRRAVAEAEQEVARREVAEARARQGGALAEVRRAVAEASAARKALLGALARRNRVVRSVLPETAPRSADEIRALLAPDERMLVYGLGETASHAFVVAPGGIRAFPLRDGEGPLAAARLAERVPAFLEALSRPDGEVDPAAAKDLFAALVPPEAWREIRAARRLHLVAHGVLHSLPFEALVVAEKAGAPVLWIDGGPPIAYVASGSVLAWVRSRHDEQRSAARPPSLLAVGDPVFAGQGSPPPWPASGVLVTAVPPGGPGATLGLRPGDVLTHYGERVLTDPASLEAAIREAAASEEESPSIPLRLLREDEEVRAFARPGPLDVDVAPEPPAVAGPRLFPEGAAPRTRGGERGRTLEALPGTREEVSRIRAAFLAKDPRGANVRTLLGREATEARVAASVAGATILHLATHGLVDETETASFSALALTRPRVPVPGDDGFLTLADLLGRWQGRLDATELVVMSACDTQRGKLRNDEGHLALPWGFHFAGCPTVVGTLWKVDDETAPVLMEDFYRRLLAQEGRDPLAALVEAKRALRKAHPHPYRWASFVLLGDPR